MKLTAKPTAKLLTAARILMGFLFFLSGLNGFLSFLPQPQGPAGAAGAFAGALAATGYMLPLIMATQLVAGALLLTNRFVPLALALLAPFLVNALAFHVFLEPTGLVIVAVFIAIELALAWSHRRAFVPMLAMKAA